MSASLWPWLAVAGAGALHGLNPCTGWALAACSRRGWQHALGAIALGHAASVGAVAGLVALGVAIDGLLPVIAGAMLLALAVLRARIVSAGLVLGSFLASAVHGSGLMLVPALVPLCLSASPAREITASGSLLLALAAVAVHMAAMLATTAVAAWAARSGFVAMRRRWRPPAPT